MHTRPYRPSDFDAAFAVIDLANRVNQTWRENPDQLRQQLADSSDLFGCILVEGEQNTLVGVITWQRTGTDYYIDGWVHPKHNGTGVGTALLRAMEHEVRKRFKRASISTRTLANIPGVESLFTGEGYHIVRRFYVMTTSLIGRTFDVPLPSGISIRPVSPDHLEALVSADNEIFADHWGWHALPIEEWTRRYIVDRPHDPALWVIAWDEFGIVGECLGHASLVGGPRDGWLAVVGVREAWRGCGLGGAVLARGFQRLQQGGYVTASLSVDTENPPAIGLYRKFGMEIARTRLNFQKIIR
jgi:mycothiol synthase